MIRLTARLDQPMTTEASVTLTLDQRARSRLRVTLDDGREAGIFLARGESLKDGDCLVSEEGIRVLVRAASEPLSTVQCRNP